jgi:hypothetical protein
MRAISVSKAWQNASACSHVPWRPSDSSCAASAAERSGFVVLGQRQSKLGDQAGRFFEVQVDDVGEQGAVVTDPMPQRVAIEHGVFRRRGESVQ